MKTLSRLIPVVFGVCGVFSPVTVYAHLVNNNVGEFYAGMLHPVTSLEHLLPILALSLIGGQCGKHAARATLFTFPAGLLAGTLAGSLLPPYGFLEVMNLMLLLGLGGLLAFQHRLTSIGPKAIVMLAVVTGLILGYRSGMDMAAAKVAVQFIPGVVLTGFILVALITAWVPIVSSRTGKILVNMAGSGFALVGMLLLMQLVTSTEPSFPRSARMPGQADLMTMLRTGDLSPLFIAGTLLAAAVWGAGHALMPGHGKAVVGAYLIGARSTPFHAVYLGLTVTLTHTLGVFALGLIALFASQYVLPEQLYPWLGILSGLIVVGMGLFMLRKRIDPLIERNIANRRDLRDHGHSHMHTSGHSHDHGHGHCHLPPGTDGSPVTWRSLLLLGVSGGLLPCPSALVLLLAAVSMNRVAFGMALVIAFSFGLAAVLTVVGLLFVKGSVVVQRVPQFTAWREYIPVASALVITVLGIMLITEAAMSLGL